MNPVLIVVLYILFCLLVSFLGRKTKIGFFGVLIASILITPLVVAILIVFFQGIGKKLKKKK